MILLSDTNASIKFAALGEVVFNDRNLIGPIVACENVGKKELGDILSQISAGVLADCIRCALAHMKFYKFQNFDQYEFYDFDLRYYSVAETLVMDKYSLGGAGENDKYFLHLAATNGLTLVTNDLPLYYLADELPNVPEVILHKNFKVQTVEDLIIEAFDKKTLSDSQVKDVIKKWDDSKRSILNIKKSLFETRGLI